MTKHFRFSGTDFANRVDGRLEVCRSTQKWTRDTTKPATCSATRTPITSFVLSLRDKGNHRATYRKCNAQSGLLNGCIRAGEVVQKCELGNAARPDKNR
jgi:hypothetical protein